MKNINDCNEEPMKILDTPDMMTSITSEMMEAYNLQYERMLRDKLDEVKRQALKKHELELVCILHKILYEEQNISKLPSELEKAGYTIEVQQEVNTDYGDLQYFKAIMSVENIKVKIKRTIIEV